MDQNKQFPPIEQSIKYMAWNVKQMDANLKRIADAVEMMVQTMRGNRTYSGEDAPSIASAPRKQVPVYEQGEIPF